MITSSLRTYRYLRIAMGGTIVVIFVAVAIVAFGEGHLRSSISAYYYSPARTAFTGALIAAGIALLAMSGHRAERALLDSAGLLAPVIALVSTPTKDPALCGPDATCVPASALPDIENGVLSYLVIGGAGWLTVVILVLTRTVEWRVARVSLVVATAALGLTAILWFVARDFFVSAAHVTSASVFFLLIGTIAVLHLRGRDDSPDPARWMRVVYGVVAVGMAIVVGIAVIAFIWEVLHPRDTVPAVPPIFTCEVSALTLFLVFWVVQSIQRWNDDSAPAAAA